MDKNTWGILVTDSDESLVLIADGKEYTLSFQIAEFLFDSLGSALGEYLGIDEEAEDLPERNGQDEEKGKGNWIDEITKG